MGKLGKGLIGVIFIVSDNKRHNGTGIFLKSELLLSGEIGGNHARGNVRFNVFGHQAIPRKM